MTKKRRRPIHLHVMVSEAEQALIQERMAEAGIRNMGAFMRSSAASDVYKRQVGMCFMLTFRLFVSWFRSSGDAPTI